MLSASVAVVYGAALAGSCVCAEGGVSLEQLMLGLVLV